MFDLQKGLPKSHINSSDQMNTIKGNYDSFYPTNSSIRFRKKLPDYENYSDPGGIEFRSRSYLKDESGISSPPLWKTSPPTSPRREIPQFHHQYRSFSPTSRSQAIARGRTELMEMVQNMPESCYELSLKDIVEKPMVQEVREVEVEERPLRNEDMRIQGGGGGGGREKKNRKKIGKREIVRSKSMDSGVFLLKMFFPISLGPKSKSSPTKVSPKPQYLEGSERGLDKEWWGKGFSGTGENDNCGKRSGSTGSSGSSDSSDSSKSRHMGGGCLPGFKSFFHKKESKSSAQKDYLF